MNILDCLSSLDLRPSLPPVVDHLQYEKEPGISYHVIHGIDYITSARHEDMFTFISLATEKFQETGQVPAERKEKVLYSPDPPFLFGMGSGFQTGQVPAKRKVLPLECIWVRSRTAEGWFRCKHCKSKSCCLLLHTYITSNSCICLMLFSVGACLIIIVKNFP